VPRDKAKATQLNRKACNSRYADACKVLERDSRAGQ